MSCEKIFFEEMKKRGYRITPQREMVLAIMHKLEKPPLQLRKFFRTYRKLAKAWIFPQFTAHWNYYKNLTSYQSSIPVIAKQNMCMYMITHHICIWFVNPGGHIQGIHLKDIETVANDIEKKLNFKIDWQDVTLHGLCEACRKKKEV